MNRVALIDGDVLVYNAGFASDARAKEAGDPHEPIEYALHSVATKIRSILTEAQADEYVIYLSHAVNEREQFYPEYKQNRDPNAKPFWYDEIKHYLLEVKGAIYSEQGDEADDALGIHQMQALAFGEEETIICTIDKDLDMIPGLHYNFSPNKRANGVYEMSDPECLRLFYKQMLTGDAVDNIPGLYRRKKKKATAAVMGGLDRLTNNRAMYNYVLDLYGEDEADYLNVMGKLLWIKRDMRWWEAPRG